MPFAEKGVLPRLQKEREKATESFLIHNNGSACSQLAAAVITAMPGETMVTCRAQKLLHGGGGGRWRDEYNKPGRFGARNFDLGDATVCKLPGTVSSQAWPISW